MRSLLRALPRRNIWDRVRGAWYEAFPKELDVESIQKERIQKAKLKKTINGTEFTTEQLEQMEKDIPEWKRGAVTFVRFIDEPAPSKWRKYSVSQKLKDYYKKNENEEMLKLIEELEGVKDSAQVMRENIQQKMLYSDSVIVKTGLTAVNKIKEKLSADAVAEMKKRDPTFDFDIFEKEIRFIFEEMYQEFLKHNVKYLEKICAGEALGHFRGMIAEHQAKFGKPKYTEILNVSFPVLEASFLTEDKIPIFAFSMNFQEIFCLIDPKNPETILDGDERRMVSCDYLAYVMPHPDPDIEAVGHPWIFFNLVQRNKVKQLI